MDQKVHGSKTGRPLIYCGSKVCSNQAGQGPISNKIINNDKKYFFWRLLTILKNKTGKKYGTKQQKDQFFCSKPGVEL